MLDFTENLALESEASSSEGAGRSKSVKTNNFSVKCGILSQYIYFFQKVPKLETRSDDTSIYVYEHPPPPLRTLQPSKSTLWWVKFAIFSPNDTFLRFSSLLFTHMSGNASNPKVNFFVKWSVFSQYIVSKKTNYEKMSIFTKDSLLGSDDQKRSLVVPPPCWLFSWKTRGGGNRWSNSFPRFFLFFEIVRSQNPEKEGGG